MDKEIVFSKLEAASTLPPAEAITEASAVLSEALSRPVNLTDAISAGTALSELLGTEEVTIAQTAGSATVTIGSVTVTDDLFGMAFLKAMIGYVKKQAYASYFASNKDAAAAAEKPRRDGLGSPSLSRGPAIGRNY